MTHGLFLRETQISTSVKRGRAEYTAPLSSVGYILRSIAESRVCTEFPISKQQWCVCSPQSGHKRNKAIRRNSPNTASHPLRRMQLLLARDSLNTHGTFPAYVLPCAQTWPGDSPILDTRWVRGVLDPASSALICFMKSCTLPPLFHDRPVAAGYSRSC